MGGDYSNLDFERLLRKNKWFLVRQKGSHKTYRNDFSEKIISIPCKDINKMMCKRLIKEFGLVG